MMKREPLNPRDVYKSTRRGLKSDQKKYGNITRESVDEIGRVVGAVKEGRVEGDDLVAAKALIMGLANEELNYAQRTGNLSGAVSATQLYDVIGRGDSVSVQRRLRKAIDKAEEVQWNPRLPKVMPYSTRRDVREQYKEVIEKYIHKHPAKKSLESTTTALISMVGLLLGLAFLTPNLTGNVVGNLSEASTNIIGVVLFLIGLTGAFVYFRRR